MQVLFTKRDTLAHCGLRVAMPVRLGLLHLQPVCSDILQNLQCLPYAQSPWSLKDLAQVRGRPQQSGVESVKAPGEVVTEEE